MTLDGVTSRPDDPFWRGLAEGRLRIPACDACGVWTWPPQWRCGRCGGWEMNWRSTPMEGVVHAFTYTRHPFSAAQADEVPYPVLLVSLPAAGGVRLLGRLDGGDSGLAVGSAVTGAIVSAASGGLRHIRWSLSEDEPAA